MITARKRAPRKLVARLPDESWSGPDRSVLGPVQIDSTRTLHSPEAWGGSWSLSSASCCYQTVGTPAGHVSPAQCRLLASCCYLGSTLPQIGALAGIILGW